MVKKIVTIGPVDPEIFGDNWAPVKEKKKLQKVKYTARPANLPSGLNNRNKNSGIGTHPRQPVTVSIHFQQVLDQNSPAGSLVVRIA